MKVTVKLTIEVDPKTWAESNGYLMDGDGRFKVAEVREDIRSYVLHQIQATSIIDETDAEVTGA
jgi:hypothetical protein